MKMLTNEEIDQVSGGGDLRQPIDNPQTDTSRLINEVAQAINDLGNWLGAAVFDLTHSGAPPKNPPDEKPKTCQK
jgi:hypothetical protein